MTLRERREIAGLTQKEVAEVLEVDQGSVSHWEKGEYVPHKKHRVKLANLYKCKVDELFPDN